MTALDPEYREEQVDAPALHPPGFSVSMTGKVRKPLTPTLNDLRRRPRVTQPSILERAGNGHGIDGAYIIRSRGHCPIRRRGSTGNPGRGVERSAAALGARVPAAARGADLARDSGRADREDPAAVRHRKRLGNSEDAMTLRARGPP